jgi:hypothetical protein
MIGANGNVRGRKEGIRGISNSLAGFRHRVLAALYAASHPASATAITATTTAAATATATPTTAATITTTASMDS